MISLEDTRCIRCDGNLVWMASPASLEISDSAIHCEKCGQGYPAISGIPVLCQYDEAETLGLIEITANADHNPQIPRESMADLEKTLAQYHLADEKDKQQILEKSAYGPYILPRYNEWTQINSFLTDLDLTGKKVLDVGAGVGFDSHRLVQKGAHVTALEISPLLCRAGKKSLPEIRWVGGLSHILPFKDQTFDFIFCNAALHHMRDIPATMTEMLRALKPGGSIITTCDSFRADSLGEDLELHIFNNNPDVLMGVNERIPRLREFLQMPTNYQDHLQVKIISQGLQNVPREADGRTAIPELKEWSLETTKQHLSHASGGIAMRLDLKKPVRIEPKTQKSSGLSPAEFVRNLSSQALALSVLATRIPNEYVNIPFPGSVQTKFELLNGWMFSRNADQRVGYRRGRWYLRRQQSEMNLTFEIRAFQKSETARTFSILVNNESVFKGPLSSNWQSVDIDLASIASGTSFCVEIRVNELHSEMDQNKFCIRKRNLAFVPISLHDKISRLSGGLKRWLTR